MAGRTRRSERVGELALCSGKAAATWVDPWEDAELAHAHVAIWLDGKIAHAPRAAAAPDRRVRVAWLWEPRLLMPEHYDFVLRGGAERFDEVWTDDLQMRDDLERLAAAATRRRIRFRFLTQALAFVAPPDRDPCARSSQRWAEFPVSLIASRKKVRMPDPRPVSCSLCHLASPSPQPRTRGSPLLKGAAALLTVPPL